MTILIFHVVSAEFCYIFFGGVMMKDLRDDGLRCSGVGGEAGERRRACLFNVCEGLRGGITGYT